MLSKTSMTSTGGTARGGIKIEEQLDGLLWYLRDTSDVSIQLTREESVFK